jgi:hypothetical protein
MTAPDGVVDIDADIDTSDALPPYMRLLQSPYPVHRIWQVNQPEWQGDDAVSLNEGGVNLLIHRVATSDSASRGNTAVRYELVLQPLSDEQFRALSE